MITPEPAPGQTWRSLGKAGHTRHRVTIVKRTAGGRVVLAPATSTRHRAKNRVCTLSLDAFLNNYTPEGVPHDRPAHPAHAPDASPRCPPPAAGG